MASFSIHDLLGLNKDKQRTGSKCETGVGSFFKPQKESRQEHTEEDDDVIDVESYDEDNSHQLVTVEVRTMRHASNRSSSRKRKRTEPAKERESTPDTDGEWSAQTMLNVLSHALVLKIYN